MTEKIMVHVHVPAERVRLTALAAGFILGLLMVGLDPYLRFPDVPTRVNWRDALLSAIVIGFYGMLLAWVVTTYWRSRLIWLVTFFISPVMMVMFILWNEVTSALGATEDLLVFIPVMLLLNFCLIALILMYLNIVRHLSGRQMLALTAVPLVLAMLVFMVLVRLRSANGDAQDVMLAVNQYAGGLPEQDYEIEYLGIAYRQGRVSTGLTRIHGENATYYCQSDLFDPIETVCRLEEDE